MDFDLKSKYERMPKKLKTIAPENLAPLSQRVSAWMVHLFTMSGVAFAALATLALIHEEIGMMWLWLFIALVVDGVDGTMARKFRVREVLPWFDGGILDIIIDYLTWTFIPAIFMYRHIEMGQPYLAAVLTVLILATSTLCYANENWKSSDFYFYGFPAAWNIVALCLYVLQTSEVVNIIVVVACIVLTVVPSYWTHPFRVKKFMVVNLISIAVWIGVTGALVAIYPAQPVWMLVLFYVSGGWFLLTGIARMFTGPDRASRKASATA